VEVKLAALSLANFLAENHRALRMLGDLPPEQIWH
jgi:hypothetical protein